MSGSSPSFFPDTPGRGLTLDERDPEAIRRWMPVWGWLYRNYFRVQTEGWEHIGDEQVLLVGSHNGGLAAPDMIMMIYDWFRRFGPDRLIYGLKHPVSWRVYSQVAQLASEVGAIQARPKLAMAALKRGASVLVYPGGAYDVFRPYSQRHQIELQGHTGFVRLALRYEVPIIPLISCGAHETFMVLGDIYEPVNALREQLGLPWPLGLDPEVMPIYLGLPWGLAVGPLPHFPIPTQIHTRVCRPIHFDRYGQEAARDRDYVRACYDRVVREMQTQLDDLVRRVSEQSS